MRGKGLGAVLLVMVLLMCAVSGCTWRNREEKAKKEQKLLTIGFSQVGAESDWRTANSVSVKETFTLEKGYNLIFEDAKQMQENQIRAIRGFIQQDVDYIVFSPVVENGWDTVLEEAKRAEIPVIVIDRMVDVRDDSLFTAWIGSDFYLQGQKACATIEEYVKKRGIPEVNIVNIQGTPGSTSQVARTKALEDAVKENGWNLLAQESGEYTKAKAYEVMKKMLEEHEEINFVYCENDNEAFGAIDAIRDAGKTVGPGGDVQVISFDATRRGLESTQKGEILINMECNPLQGPGVEQAIQKMEAGQTPEKKQYVQEYVFVYETGISEIEVEGRQYFVTPVTEEIIEGREY